MKLPFNFHYVTILSAVSIIPLSSFSKDGVGQVTPHECTRDWAMSGQMKSKGTIYGLGVSAQNDLMKAQSEAKSNAYKDIAQQLQSSVHSESKLNETEAGSNYSAETTVLSNSENLVGVKVLKTGKSAASGFSHCMALKFDVASAYTEMEGEMNVLTGKLESAFDAAKSKSYIEVIQKRKTAQDLIEKNDAMIKKADLYRMYLAIDSQSWVEKIKSQQLAVEKIAEEAKSKIVFIFPTGIYENSVSEVESKLSGAGFETSSQSKTKKPVKIVLDIQQLGPMRKSKTVLGFTDTVSIALKLIGNEGKTIATSRGVSVTGTGSDEDEALANLDRQMLVHLLDLYHSGLPGLIDEN